MIRRIVVSLLLVLASHSSLAVNKEFSGAVKGFYVNKHGIVNVNIEHPTATPDCNYPTWPFTFNVADIPAQVWLSMLLASKTTGDTIKLGYEPSVSGSCNVHYFYYLN